MRTHKMSPKHEALERKLMAEMGYSQEQIDDKIDTYSDRMNRILLEEQGLESTIIKLESK